MRIKISTWNIAGGHTVSSLEQHQYDTENISYFSETLNNINADIICIQESHVNKHTSIARQLAQGVGVESVVEEWGSASHVDPNFDKSIAVISKEKSIDNKCFWYPYPWWEMKLPNGNLAAVFNKNLQVVEFTNLVVINTQLHALGFLGFDYNASPADKLSRLIDKLFVDVLDTYQNKPIVFCGDFNTNSLPQTFPQTFAEFNLKDALPDKLTRPNNKGLKLTPDHILYNPKLVCRGSGIEETATDHYLCWAEFEI